MNGALLVLLPALLLQDTDDFLRKGRESLRTTEDKLLKAKSARIRFKATMKLNAPGECEDPIQLRGTLLIGAGNRMRLELERVQEEAKGEGSKSLVVCDGDLLVREGEGFDTEEPVGVDRTFRARLAPALARAGLIPVFMAGSPVLEGGELPDAARITSSRAGVVVHSIRTHSCLPEAKVTLAYDEKTLLPRERTVEYALPDRKVTVVETYEEFTLDPELAASSFALPEPKDAK